MIPKMKAELAALDTMFLGERSLSGHLTEETIAKAIVAALEAYIDASFEEDDEERNVK